MDLHMGHGLLEIRQLLSQIWQVRRSLDGKVLQTLLRHMVERRL
jgi:hypothetical protein